jgi:hypothetical protein
MPAPILLDMTGRRTRIGMNDHHTDGLPDAGIFEIRLAGQLDPRWGGRFDGLTLDHEPSGITVLRGAIADQAALHGILRQIRDLGVPLVSVTRLDDDRA